MPQGWLGWTGGVGVGKGLATLAQRLRKWDEAIPVLFKGQTWFQAKHKVFSNRLSYRLGQAAVQQLACLDEAGCEAHSFEGSRVAGSRGVPHSQAPLPRFDLEVEAARRLNFGPKSER